MEIQNGASTPRTQGEEPGTLPTPGWTSEEEDPNYPDRTRPSVTPGV